jgi:hypothetical protein
MLFYKHTALIISDITFFFVHIKTENREKISIANNIFLQKNISIVLHKDEHTTDIK